MESPYDVFFDEQCKEFNRSLLQTINTKFSDTEKHQLKKSFLELIRNSKQTQIAELMKEKEENEKFLQSLILTKLKSYDYKPKAGFSPSIKQTLQRCYHYVYTHETAKFIEKEHFCSICTFDFKPEDKIVMLVCQHSYHIECIENWFQNKINCPLCRDNLIKSSHLEILIKKKAQLQKLKQKLKTVQTRSQNLENLANTFISQITFKRIGSQKIQINKN